MSLFNDTPETIKARILGRMGTNLQTREGSFANDCVAPVSFELWRMKMSMEELLCAFYVDEHSGPYLDDAAGLQGLARKIGSAASCPVAFSGMPGAKVPPGTIFLTGGGLEYSLREEVTLDGDGAGSGILDAARVGSAYNAGAGEISQILRSVQGLKSWSNGAASGGADAESDADLFARIDDRRKNPATSGNEAHYRQWALECDGVGECRVTELWAGPGTVRVLLVDYDRQPVEASVVSAVAEHIETLRPVGADVTVTSAAGTAIDVTATVTLDGTVELADVQAVFARRLDEWLRAMAFQSYTVYYNRVAALLLGVEGVADYTALTVNGGTANITIGETAVPVIGEVALT